MFGYPDETLALVVDILREQFFCRTKQPTVKLQIDLPDSSKVTFRGLFCFEIQLLLAIRQTSVIYTKRASFLHVNNIRRENFPNFVFS